MDGSGSGGNPGNFPGCSASNPMSSVSGAQYEADLPPHAGAERSPAPDSSELELIKKAQLGDRGAYGRLVGLYQDRLYNAILRLVGDHDEARELAQETFTRGL